MLGESIKIVAPAEPIAQRVTAIREELRPDEPLLLLSPFDHLLSFYVNPKSYCGHFDVLTNVVTTDNVLAIQKCVNSRTDVLVVYDRALATPCPTLVADVLHFTSECRNKFLAKQNLLTILELLRPSLVEQSSKGDLVFYRIKQANRARQNRP